MSEPQEEIKPESTETPAPAPELTPEITSKDGTSQAQVSDNLHMKLSADRFSKILDSVIAITGGDITDTLIFKPDGLHIFAANEGKNFMIIVSLPAEDMIEYKCEKEILIGLEFKEVKSLIKKGTSFVTIDITDGKYKFILDRGSYTVKFNLHYFEGKAALPTPKMNFTTKLILDPDLLSGILSDMHHVSEGVRLETEGNIFSITAEGDKGESEVTLGEGTMYPITIDCKEPASTLYSLGFLNDVVKSFKALGTETIELEYTTKQPLRVISKIGNAGEVLLFCTPRLDSGERKKKR